MPEGGALRISTQVVSGGAEEQRSKGEASISPLHSSTSALLSPYITLTITDTGVGMSPEVMTKIFEPLYTTKARGIGLGLTVSKNLVEVNSGTIEVESVKSQGSTFTITLPTRETAL
jgi:signal transduction histidine kinase